MKRIKATNLSIFFKEKSNTKKDIEKKTKVLEAINSGVPVDQECAIDCALAIFMSFTNPKINKIAIESHKIFVEGNKELETSLKLGCAENIEQHIASGDLQKARAHIISSFTFPFDENEREEKQKIVGVLNKVSSDPKIAAILRTNALTSSFSLNLNESDDALCETVKCMTGQIDEKYSFCTLAVERLAKGFRVDSEYTKALHGKPKTVKEIAFLMDYASQVFKDAKYEADDLDNTLQILETIDGEAVKNGKAFGHDRFKSYVLISDFAKFAKENNHKASVLITPSYNLMMF